MSQKDYTFSFENEDIAFFVDENIAILRFRDNFLSKISDIEKSGKILTVLDWIERDPIINTLLILNESDAYSAKSYSLFMDSIMIKDEEKRVYSVLPEKKLLLVRQIHAIRIFINKLLNYEKSVIFGLKDSVTTLAFALSLTGDYRFANKNLVFSLPNKIYNFPAIGGLPFLLVKYIGQQELSSILLEGKSIDSQSAKDLNLLNNIIDEENFEEKCIEKAKELSIKDNNFIKLTRKSIHYYQKELEDYFNYEAKISGF